jgi:hypothetical protein
MFHKAALLIFSQAGQIISLQCFRKIKAGAGRAFHFSRHRLLCVQEWGALHSRHKCRAWIFCNHLNFLYEKDGF